MLFLGAFAMIGAAFMIWREYVSYIEREHAFSRELLRAFSDLEEKMRCYLMSSREWAIGYDSALLDECGFLGALRDGERLEDAFSASFDNMTLPDEVSDMILDFAGSFGEGYLDTELVQLDSLIRRLSEAEARLGGEVPRRRKVAGAFLGACASGLVVLIM